MDQTDRLLALIALSLAANAAALGETMPPFVIDLVVNAVLVVLVLLLVGDLLLASFQRENDTTERDLD